MIFSGFINIGSASDGKIAFWGNIAGGLTTSVGGFNDGTWHHCALVRSSGNLDIYVDGISYASTAVSATMDHASPWIIGNSYYASRGYTGYIDI